MLRYIVRQLMSAFLWVKYRRLRFGAVGSGCVYRASRSKFAYASNIYLGDNVHIGPGCLLDGAGGINIQRGTIIAPDVVIYSRTHNFDIDLGALPFDNVMLISPVNIGEFVWIGTRVIILPGVTIGDGAVVGAGAVVSRDIPACGVAVGNPARVVRHRNTEKFEKLRAENDPSVFTRFGHSKVFKRKEV